MNCLLDVVGETLAAKIFPRAGGPSAEISQATTAAEAGAGEHPTLVAPPKGLLLWQLT